MPDRPRLYKTEALILKGVRTGEADRILTLFTPGLGKLHGVARGVAKVGSKLAGHLEPLTRSALVLARGKNLDVITQSQSQESFAAIKGDLERTSRALYLAELVDGFAAEGAENYPLYRLLLEAWRWLEEGLNLEVALRYFEVQLLGYVGYRPELHSCLSCRRELEPGTNFFSSEMGGVLCPECRGEGALARPLSLDALKVMRLLQGGEEARARRLRLGPGLERELEGLLRGYITYRLEREIKSARFLDRLRREATPGSPNYP